MFLNFILPKIIKYGIAQNLCNLCKSADFDFRIKVNLPLKLFYRDACYPCILNHKSVVYFNVKLYIVT